MVVDADFIRLFRIFIKQAVALLTLVCSRTEAHDWEIIEFDKSKKSVFLLLVG